MPGNELPIVPDMVRVAGGAFFMGSNDGPENEQPRHEVNLDAFMIAKTPVTNDEYHRFVVSRGVGTPPFCSDDAFSHPRKPVVGINWNEANAYCGWLGEMTGRAFRLPTEAEWERAARGGRTDALYPWGNELPSERPFPGFDTTQGGPQTVGENEPNDFGLYDMSEGVHEWCQDFYDAAYYRFSPVKDPRGPVSGTRRVSRGGSWRHHVKFSRCAARSSLNPLFRYNDYGFRVALTGC